MRKGLMVIIVAIALMMVGIINAAPTGPRNLNEVATSRYVGATSGWEVDAVAGNVTELIINATSVTQTWQGYYGNVIGAILLSDSSNNTLIDWTITGVQGQVYASRTNGITWTGIGCANTANITAEDTYLGSLGKADAVNNTFSNSTTHDGFFVGTEEITANSCSAVNLKNSTGYSSDWQEVLLSTANGERVYTALLSSNNEGFNGSSYDFQMIVGENGHSGDVATTPYYFWIELT